MATALRIEAERYGIPTASLAAVILRDVLDKTMAGHAFVERYKSDDIEYSREGVEDEEDQGVQIAH